MIDRNVGEIRLPVFKAITMKSNVGKKVAYILKKL